MFDYQKPDRGWCGDPARGAAMGRGSNLPFSTTDELAIRRVPIDDGGYDPGGTYWGSTIGSTLFCVFDKNGRVAYLRAADVDAAKGAFPKATFTPMTAPTEADLADMLGAYLRCALFAESDNATESGGSPLDANYTESDFAPETLASMRADVEAFALANHATLVSAMNRSDYRCDWGQAGHDLWLNRNRHGCGFWDGDWPQPEGELLSEAAKKMGEVDLCVGDDGKIYSA